MESPKNTHITLTNLGLVLKEKMTLVKHENEQINALKQEIREIMIESGSKEFENKDHNLTIKCTRSFSFDIGMFKLEEPNISKDFIKKEIITKTRDVLDKKSLQKLLPATYTKFLIENTARLTVR